MQQMISMEYISIMVRYLYMWIIVGYIIDKTLIHFNFCIISNIVDAEFQKEFEIFDDICQ